MIRCFKIPARDHWGRPVVDFEINPDARLVFVKDWLRNRADYLVYEVEMTDTQAVEFMLRVDGAEPCEPFKNGISVEDELASVLAGSEIRFDDPKTP